MLKTLLSAEVRARLDARHAELLRLYKLTDPWLGVQLLKLTRTARSYAPNCRSDGLTYESGLVWSIVPELARRLAPHVRLLLPEIDWEVRALSHEELRIRIGHTLANVGRSELPGWDLLTAEAPNGNPVMFGIDRLCPGNLANPEDRLSVWLAAIAKTRDASYRGVWTPRHAQRAARTRPKCLKPGTVRTPPLSLPG